MKFLEVIKKFLPIKNNQSNKGDYESIRFIMDFLQCPCEVIKGGTYTSESLMKRMTEELEKVAKAREAGEDYALPLLIIPSSYLVESLESFLEEHEVSLADSLIAVRKEVARIQSFENEARAFLAQDLIEIWGEEERAFVQELESDLQSPTTNNQSKGLRELIIFREDEHQDLILAQIPARESYELACCVPMGDFNECPAPSLQAAIFKEWSKRLNKRFYPAVVSYCEWQCMILPSKKEDFISDEQTLSQLAREHLIFNPDILQSCENLQEYKTMLKYSSVWYFWWD